MTGMVIDPRGRLQRRWFLYDLILPNIAAAIAIITLRIIDMPFTDIAIGAIAVILVWSANVAAPIARMHDIGAPAWLHLAVLAVVLLLGTFGSVRSLGEIGTRVGEILAAIRSGEDDLPGVSEGGAGLAGLIAFIEVVALAFWPGQRGTNRFGDDPRGKE